MVDWNDLRYLVAVARVGTLAGAARALNVDQTTCGRRLQALEEALGVRLEVERRVAGEDVRLDGVVRVATSDTLAVGFVVGALAELRARQPGIIFETFRGD